MEITGHSTREMFDRYNRIDEEDTRKAIVQMQDFLASVDQTAKRGCGYCRNPLFYWRALEGSNLGPLDFFVFRQSNLLFRDTLEKCHHLIQYR